MNYLGIEYDYKNKPSLEPEFIPFQVWAEAFLKEADRPVRVAVARDHGSVSVFESRLRGEEFAEANFRYFAGDASSEAVKFVKFDAEGASSGCFQISELVLTGAKAEAPADEKLDQKAEAPNTFDFGVVAAVAAVISLGGFAASKKKH